MTPTVLKTRVDQLWDEWLQAREKAQQSGRIEDGMEAGRAWSAFLAEFVKPQDRSGVHG